MAWSAASARALLAASPIASVEPPAIGERITEWLKITAVPLLVFLVGACIWGCIQNRVAWRALTEGGGGSTHNEALGEVRSDAPRAISNNEAARDLETGLELPEVRCSDEESDSSSMRPWMEVLVPIPTSEMRLAVDKELRLDSAT